jgi:hypothetical protein
LDYRSCFPTYYVLPRRPQVFREAEPAAVAEHEVVAFFFPAAELSADVGLLAVEPGVFFVAVASVADAAEPQASVGIAVAFLVLVPVSLVVVEGDNSGRPMFAAFPNVDHYASSSSSVEVVGWEFVHSSSGARTNYGLCSTLANLGQHQNKNSGPCHNNPSPGYNNVNDTNDLPMDATTSHSRKRSLPLDQEQRKHRSYQASLSHPEVP